MPHWLYLLLTVPSVSGLIGWLTNWQAVKMIFWPEVRVGRGLLSWQGIVFHHADKFATNLGRVARQNLLSGEEVVAKLDPASVEALMHAPLDSRLPTLIAAAAEQLAPGAWARLPEPVRAMVLAQAGARVRAISSELVTELATAVAAELDIEQLVREQLSGPNVRRLARLTHEIGHKEFRFIEWSGGVFGVIIGVAQLSVWSVMQLWWLMPIFGVGVGLVTNYLALQMIFRPHQRTRYLGIPYQGLFPRRQAEIARDYGRTTAAEVITPATLIDFLLAPPRSERLRGVLERAIASRLEREYATVKGLISLPITEAQLTALRDLVMAEVLTAAAELRPAIEQALGQALQIRATVEERLSQLSKPEFERLLRGVFQEDELTLILVGGVLGGAVGALQAALVLW